MGVPETWIALACGDPAKATWHRSANSAGKDEHCDTTATAGALDLANEMDRWGNNMHLVPIGAVIIDH